MIPNRPLPMILILLRYLPLPTMAVRIIQLSFWLLCCFSRTSETLWSNDPIFSATLFLENLHCFIASDNVSPLITRAIRFVLRGEIRKLPELKTRVRPTVFGLRCCCCSLVRFAAVRATVEATLAAKAARLACRKESLYEPAALVAVPGVMLVGEASARAAWNSDEAPDEASCGAAAAWGADEEEDACLLLGCWS